MKLFKYATLLEADKKNATDTKEREKVNNLDDLLSGPKSRGSVSKPEPKAEPKSGSKSSAGLKSAGAEKTRSKMANVSIPAHSHVINTDELNMSDEMDDDEAAMHAGLRAATHGVEPKPVTPNMLPAVISKAMVTMGKNVANIDPEWHMVKHLPGYMSRAIRALGRQVFSPFTRTPIENIQVIAHVGGGPNTETEIDAVSKFVSGHGTRDKAAELAFKKVLPDYSAQVVSYNCEGVSFFMVKDFAGSYIYAWPEKDSKDVAGMTVPRGIEQSRKALAQDKKLLGHDAHSDVEDLMKKYGL